MISLFLLRLLFVLFTEALILINSHNNINKGTNHFARRCARVTVAHSIVCVIALGAQLGQPGAHTKN